MPEQATLSEQTLEFMAGEIADSEEDGDPIPSVEECRNDMVNLIEDLGPEFPVERERAILKELDALVIGGFGNDSLCKYASGPRESHIIRLQNELIEKDKELREAKHLLGLILESAKSRSERIRNGQAFAAMLMTPQMYVRIARAAGRVDEAVADAVSDFLDDVATVTGASVERLPDDTMVAVSCSEWNAAVRLAKLILIGTNVPRTPPVDADPGDSGC